MQCAKAGARCDYGLYVAGTLDNASSVCKLAGEAIALKMYLNETFASLKMDNMMQWLEVHLILLHSFPLYLTSYKKVFHSTFVLFDMTVKQAVVNKR